MRKENNQGSALKETSGLDSNEIDTVVVPARKDGFEKVFLGEDRWYAIRIRANVRSQIKFIAGYQVAPMSAITHVARVRSIEPWKGSDKFVINFAEKAYPINPIRLVRGGRVQQLYGLRYAKKTKLDSAATLDDVW